MEQETWNLLFGWMNPGKQCMLPEGCSIPVEGVAVYITLLLAAAGAGYWLKNNQERLPW